MAKIDINMLARMITEDPDIFLENEIDGYNGRKPQVLWDKLLKMIERLSGIKWGRGPEAKIFGHIGGPRDTMMLWFTPQNSKILNSIYQDWTVLSSDILDFVLSQAKNLGEDYRDAKTYTERIISGIMTIVDEDGDTGTNDPRFLPTAATPRRKKGIRIYLSGFEDLRENMSFAMDAAANVQRRNG